MSNPFNPNEDQTPESGPIYSPGYLDQPPLNSELKKQIDPKYDGPTSNTILTLFAWFTIIALTSLLFGLTTYTQYYDTAEESVASGPELMQVNFQSKIMVGVAGLLEAIGQPNQEVKQDISTLNTGPPEQRYCYAVLVNEMEGPDEAYQAIMNLKEQMDETEGFEYSADQERIQGLLIDLFDNYSIGEWDADQFLTQDDKQFLVDQLGWAGHLVVHPQKGPDDEGRRLLVAGAKNTMIKILVLGLAVLLMGLAGLIALIVLFVMAANGTLRSQFLAAEGRGGIYAETFAVWLLLFFFGSIGLGIAQGALQLSSEATIFCQLAVFFGSLIALVYPAVRGVPFSTVREDIGWKLQNPFKEMMMGGFSYIATMPVIAVGMLGTVLLVFVTAEFSPVGSHQFISSGGGGHPIQDEIASGNLLMIIGVFLTACVAAPVVEETMFRGVLYRHLRENNKMARALVVIFSAIVSAFVFAIIHPQGIIGVPVLMSLAIGFAICREWRSSLIAPMTMHAIHNSLVTCVLLLML